MRSYDKIKNMNKVNLLAEQRHLNELGDGSGKIYDFHLENQGEDFVTVGFTTDKGVDYQIFFNVKEELDTENNEIKAASVLFSAKGSSFHKVVNKGELFSVMATVVQAVKLFLDMKEFSDVERLDIEPTKSDKGDNRRFNLYMTYIKKQIPQARVETGQAGGGVDYIEIYLDRESESELEPKVTHQTSQI